MLRVGLALPCGVGRPSLGKFDDAEHGTSHFGREFEAETFPFSIVVANRLDQFGTCRVEEADLHRELPSASISSKTSDAGKDAISPRS